MHRIVRAALWRVVPLATITAVAVACLPGAEPPLAAPTFRLVSESSGIVRLDVAALGAPRATVGLALEVHNPNAFPVRVAGVDGALFLAGQEAGGVRFPSGLDLPARGQSRVDVEVEVGSATIGTLQGTFADAIVGRPTPYRLEVGVTLDVLGAAQRFPRATVLSGELRSDLALRPPRLELDQAASGVSSLAFDRVVVDLALVMHNDGPVAVVVRAPDVRVELGGRAVAGLQVASTPVPSRSSASTRHQLVLNPAALGAAVVAELTRLAAGEPVSLELALQGSWELSVPGITTTTTPTATLLRGRLE